ncbi:hypothetical protein [uncultured Parabacteroides sp.]|uniref:hypothetical protein n=1 Tax=uncultured Parabacteroides sp. TaxID=512312 RepID=UPI0026ED5878|nr:hypothetical protein [uncultured Parabacteroides sp.]
MGNLEQIISFGRLSNLFQRYNQGQSIGKEELHTAIESCKHSLGRDTDDNDDTADEAIRKSPKFALIKDKYTDALSE